MPADWPGEHRRPHRHRRVNAHGGGSRRRQVVGPRSAPPRSDRRQLARSGGTEIKSTGDGLLATFEGPARENRCAPSTCDAVTSLGISICAGIHAGETEYVSGDIVGIGVQLAARVADVAAPGEVLVTRTVTELVAGSGIVYHGRIGERAGAPSARGRSCSRVASSAKGANES